MSDLLEVGIEFESFDAFQAAMEQYEDTHFIQFSRIDSRSVEKAQEVTPTKMYNPVIQFVQLTYACTFGPRKVASKSSGIRNTSSRKIDCPVRLRISSTPDGQRLVIRESQLDGHNHEVSEELYKSMSRQKQLEEETEVEIFNLISSHNDKRLARMLVRDRLTQEMGRSISIKDILNIEKKIARRLEREKSLDKTKICENSEETLKGENNEESTMEATNEGTEEAPKTEEVTEPSTDNTEGKENQDNPEEDHHKELDSEEEGDTVRENKADSDGDSNTEKAPPPKKAKSQPSSATRRPQRHRREPRRFRDALTNGTKVLHTSKDKVVSILSPEEVEEIGSAVLDTPSRSVVKVKEEAGVRGRKRKQEDKRVSWSDADFEAEEEYRRKKLAIQEELLEMERKRIKMLDTIVEKLDLILHNQSKT